MRKFAIGEECKEYSILIIEAETYEDAIKKIKEEYDDIVGEDYFLNCSYVDITDIVVEEIGQDVFDDLQDTTGDNFDVDESEKKLEIFNTLEWGNLVKGVFYDKEDK